MTPVHGPVKHTSLRSAGNRARMQVMLEALRPPCANIDGARVHREGKKRLQELGDHPLAPAMGIINGLRLSIVLWGFILLSAVLIW